MGGVLHALFVALNVLYYCGTVNAACPNGWTRFRDSCYLFYHTDLTFSDAQHLCQRHSAHLAHVETAVENTFIKSYIKDLQDAEYWIGLTDDVVEGLWTWVDTDTPATFTDWNPGQPDQGKAADCTILWQAVGFRWADSPCTESYHPICERRLDGEVVPAIG